MSMCQNASCFQKNLRESPHQNVNLAIAHWDQDPAHDFAQAANAEGNMAVSCLHRNHSIDPFHTSTLGSNVIGDPVMLAGHAHHSLMHDSRELASYEGLQPVSQGSQFTIPDNHTNATHPSRQLGSYQVVPPSDLSFADESDEEQTVPVFQPRRGVREFSLSDQVKVKAFLASRLKKLQQLVDKKIAKAWIKGICPKKQAKFPYQNKARKHNDNIRQDVPGWWPAIDECRFIEPDHIKRDERMQLCLHLLTLRPTPRQLVEWNNGSTEPNPVHIAKGWTAFLEELAGPSIFDDLPKESEDKTNHRKLLMQQMYQVAALEEEFLRNGSKALHTTFYWPDDDERRLTPVKRLRDDPTEDHALPSSRLRIVPKRFKSCTTALNESHQFSSRQPSVGIDHAVGYQPKIRRGSEVCFSATTDSPARDIHAASNFWTGGNHGFDRNPTDALRHHSMPQIYQNTTPPSKDNGTLRGPAERSAAEQQRKLQEVEQAAAIAPHASASPTDSAYVSSDPNNGPKDLSEDTGSFSFGASFESSFDAWALHNVPEPNIIPISNDSPSSPATLVTPSLLGPNFQYAQSQQQLALTGYFFGVPVGELNAAIPTEFENAQSRASVTAQGEANATVPMKYQATHTPPMPQPEPCFYTAPIPRGPSWFNRGFTGYGSGVGGGQPT